MPTDTIANDEQTATQLTEGYGRITNELGKAIIGQREPIDQILIALIAGGHCLLTGAPGLAKTGGTALTQGEIAFVEAMMAKFGDGTSDGSKGHGTGFGYKKMAKDREINVTGVTAGGCKRLFARYRKQRQAAALADG